MKLYASKRIKAAQILPDKRYNRIAKEIAESKDSAKQQCKVRQYTLKAVANSFR